MTTTTDLLPGQLEGDTHNAPAWQQPNFPPGQFELGTQSSHAGREPKLLRKPFAARNPRPRRFLRFYLPARPIA